MFKGVATALITPFNYAGVDYNALERLIEFQIESGIDALVVCGTTGEPSTMTADERKCVIEFAINKINNRVPVIVGTGSNCTATAVSNSIEAEKMGADMVLVVTPYYNKCTQSGLISHYGAISEALNIPIITYNVPGRTGVNITSATARKLAEFSNITAIKEACGNLSQIAATCNELRNTNMKVYSGDDGLILPILSLGAEGLISVASNAIPKEMLAMVHNYMNGNISKAQELYFRYLNFMEGIFIETNPIPIKFACNALGYCENVVRLPLTPMSMDNSSKLMDIMKDAKII